MYQFPRTPAFDLPLVPCSGSHITWWDGLMQKTDRSNQMIPSAFASPLTSFSLSCVASAYPDVILVVFRGF